MRTGKVRALIFITLASLIPLSSIESASAITSGNCSVSVANSTGVLLVENSGNCYLAFSATGANSFVVPSGVSASSVLVIAGGGGGGGGAWGGGGGSGGVLYSASYPLAAGSTMNISVGAGGAGGAANLTPASNRAANGSDSWINTSATFVAKGGGAGAGYAYGSATTSEANGSSGGSGGGGTEHGSGGAGGSSSQTLPSYGTSAFGNTGGNSTAGSGYVAGAGGGGAGSVGGAMTTSGVGGNGGAGTNAFASWFTSIGQFGVSGYIAGGGGGGSGTTAGAAGSGGAGIGGGSTSRPGANAVANTGSGGGGASYSGGPMVGGNGGSGLVIFKFTAVVLPAVVNAPTLSGTVYKGISTTITVTMDSPGKVRFFADDKRIPNCLAVATTGSSPNYSATCSWKANVTGWHFVKAILTPTNTSQAAQTSAAKSVFITKRTTFR